MRELVGFASVGGFKCLEFTPEAGGETEGALIYLHGAGERGENIGALKAYGLPMLLGTAAARVNCSVLCPQLEAEREWDPDRVAVFVGGVRQTFGRLALIGYSLGGQGVCDLVARHGCVADVAVAIAARGGEAVTAPQEGVVALTISGELDALADTTAFLKGVRAGGGMSHELVLPGHGHYISEIALDAPFCRTLLKEHGFELHFAREEASLQGVVLG